MIEVSNTEDPEVLRRLDDGLDDFNVGATGISDWEPLLAVMRDEQGQLLGGVSGHTWGCSCEIVRVWLSEELRGQGKGAALMQAAESEAARRGCTQMVLSTYSFQAPGFYESLGFERVAEVVDHPRGYASIYYVKRWEAAAGA